MVSDDPETSADLDGHAGETNSSGTAPSAGCNAPGRSQDGSMAGTSGNCSPEPNESSQGCQSPPAQQADQQAQAAQQRTQNYTWTENYGSQITIFNSTTVITPNSDGTATSTTTTTTATYLTAVPENGDHAGEFWATTETETHTFVQATNQVNSAYTVSKEKEISHADAEKVFGAQTLKSLSSQATAPRYGSHFAHAVRHDRHALVHAGAATVGGVCLLTPCAEVVVAGAFLVESANFFWERMERK